MDKTARQGLANSAGPGGVRRSSSGRLLTEPASRRHHGGARTFMRTAALVAFLVALLVGTLMAGIYLWRSEEHTSELQSLMRISYAVFCLKQKNKTKNKQ